MNPVEHTPNEDKSVAMLTADIKAKLPFYFIKLGDAACELILRKLRGVHGTCDGELYTDDLAHKLLGAWLDLRTSRGLYVGDWRTASFSGPNDPSRYDNEYTLLMSGVRGTMLHFESLLLMRDTPELLAFYRAVRNDNRRKLLLGPAEWFDLAKLLKCKFLIVPMMPNLIDIAPQIAAELKRMNFDVLLYGAGMAGHVAVIDCWKEHPGRTYVNLGSALDPATPRGRTRKQQLRPFDARMFLDRLTTEPIVTTGRGDALAKAHVRKLGMPSAERAL